MRRASDGRQSVCSSRLVPAPSQHGRCSSSDVELGRASSEDLKHLQARDPARQLANCLGAPMAPARGRSPGGARPGRRLRPSRHQESMGPGGSAACEQQDGRTARARVASSRATPTAVAEVAAAAALVGRLNPPLREARRRARRPSIDWRSAPPHAAPSAAAAGQESTFALRGGDLRSTRVH